MLCRYWLVWQDMLWIIKMNSKIKYRNDQGKPHQPLSLPHEPIVSVSDGRQCLDAVQLNRLEQSFREWVEESPRQDVQMSRRRILIIFLLIRYTGAKLSEVLSLNPFEDIDTERKSVFFHGTNTELKPGSREVQISEVLFHEIQSTIEHPVFKDFLQTLFVIDPGFVRRKFYERTQACGFPKQLGGPEMIRRARAVELMQGNMPLPAVQMLLGHSTPNLTTSYVSFSEDEMRQVTKHFMEKESSRKTSARNSFFGKIKEIQKGDIQTLVKLTTIGGEEVTTVITNDSLRKLGLKKGMMITAEVKAPWIMLQKMEGEPSCSAENRFHGTIERINKGRINTECVVRISDGTELCSIMTTESSQCLGLKEGEKVWTLFNCFAVVLHID